MQPPLRTAVIGVGYLGKFHAQKYAQLAHCELVGVVDKDAQKAQQVGQALSVPFYQDYQALFGQVDAVSVVVPTAHHYAVAKAFLQQGIHVLVEKPFTTTLEEAQELMELARQHQTCLQVGHLERFNVVFAQFQTLIERPQYIESIRISKFLQRGTDVDVILDLMIHDIDLVLALLAESPSKVDGLGISVLTSQVDLANAQLKFPNGCVANFTASRVSDKAERKMRIFQPGLYLSLDYGAGIARKLAFDPKADPTQTNLTPTTYELGKNDALLEEIQSFLHAIQQKSPPVVSAIAGFQALQIALKIKEQIQAPKNSSPTLP